ncbi:Hint domain-containing protein [Sorangium sp. So ce119]|uniref:Hint domain-containing protein n=1 Tax=Sorangium sp. So ce119 TaxID=3133279 RepID=UPI003F64276B
MKKMSRAALFAIVVPLLPGAAIARWGERNTAYTRCVGEGPTAYAVTDGGEPDPEFNEICQLPTAKAANVTESRCADAQAVFCENQVRSITKPADVPNGGIYWFAYPGINNTRMIRCTCGCFAGETEILTNQGWREIQTVLEHTTRADVRVVLPELGEGRLSAPRQPHNFTQGPEKVPVLRIATSLGKQVTLTTKHPVLVVRDGSRKMIQAKGVKTGDLLVAVDGGLTEVTSITELMLPEGDNLVFNLRTGDESGKGGVIAVNGLRMGDLTWQLRLSERESREA